MTDLLETINEIAKYGLEPGLSVDGNEKDLEASLVRLYSKYFEIDYVFDNTDYPDFEKGQFPDIITNIRANFPDFGPYHVVLNVDEVSQDPENSMGDALDDLADIIYDILEIKWRYENNSESDALWYFELIFYSHTQRHLLDLLLFLKSKNG
ncbi:MAG: hypothetical protein RIG68_15010 [Imperialibacter sp.]|uniref:hypothetical protein n=1 Tax=Imperialibacter sp. TaxID=2038411 RepID=UPI0032EF6E0B